MQSLRHLSLPRAQAVCTEYVNTVILSGHEYTLEGNFKATYRHFLTTNEAQVIWHVLHHCSLTTRHCVFQLYSLIKHFYHRNSAVGITASCQTDRQKPHYSLTVEIVSHEIILSKDLRHTCKNAQTEEVPRVTFHTPFNKYLKNV